MAADVLQKLGGASPASDAHVGVHLPQGVAHSGEVAAQVLHHVLDAAGVFEQVDALSVRVVVHRERALYRLCKLSAGKEARTGSHGGLGPGRSVVPVQTLTMRSGTTRRLPHLLLGLLEALRHEVNLLEGGDETLLVAGRLRVKHLYTRLFRQGMLGKTSADKHHFHRACARACVRACVRLCVRLCVTLNSPIDDSRPAP